MGFLKKESLFFQISFINDGILYVPFIVQMAVKLY